MFLTDDFVDGIEDEVDEERCAGFLLHVAHVFLSARKRPDLWPRHQKLHDGQGAPAFDLLYWNGDGTNLPACMAVEYLRGLCQDDKFATTGFEIAGETVHLKDVTVPLCAIACETDHIAAWKSSYAGVQQMGSKDKTFILSESRPYRGHHQSADQEEVWPLHQPRTWADGG